LNRCNDAVFFRKPAATTNLLLSRINFNLGECPMKKLLSGIVAFLLGSVVVLSTDAQAAGEYSTRKIENGTPITLTIGDTVIPATLNNSKSAKELISRLPYTVNLHRYSHDYCGVMADPLPYDEADVHNGWLNGDIDFARDGNYFTILFEDEENSQQFGHQITMGKIDGPLSVIKNLGRDIEVKIELVK